MVSLQAKREALQILREDHVMSERHACGLLDMARLSYRYCRQRKEDDGLRARLIELAGERKRFGYRRLYVLLRREGFVVNHKRIYRLYKQEGLMVKQRKRKRIAAQDRVKMLPPQHANERWSMDFVQDALANDRKVRCFTIVDDCTRESLAIEVDHSLPASRVVRVLDQLIAQRGTPKIIVLDNGPEFTGKLLDKWAYKHRIKLAFIRPGKPIENAYIETFNGKFRDECLNEHWFKSLSHARQLIEAWRHDYNRFKPHSS